MLIESVKIGECTTIGYARKSYTNESKSVCLRLLENITAILVDPCGCSKIYVTPICAANSSLLKRNVVRSSISKEIRLAHGDMQGKKNSLITCNNGSHSGIFFICFRSNLVCEDSCASY